MPTPRQIEQTAPLPTGPGQQTNLNSDQFRLRNSAKILVLVSTWVPGFECVPVTIDSLKCHCKFTYQDERTKFETSPFGTQNNDMGAASWLPR